LRNFQSQSFARRCRRHCRRRSGWSGGVLDDGEIVGERAVTRFVDDEHGLVIGTVAEVDKSILGNQDFSVMTTP
jgi:hypothetical protein